MHLVIFAHLSRSLFLFAGERPEKKIKKKKSLKLGTCVNFSPFSLAGSGLPEGHPERERARRAGPPFHSATAACQ